MNGWFLYDIIEFVYIFYISLVDFDYIQTTIRDNEQYLLSENEHFVHILHIFKFNDIVFFFVKNCIQKSQQNLRKTLNILNMRDCENLINIKFWVKIFIHLLEISFVNKENNIILKIKIQNFHSWIFLDILSLKLSSLFTT